MSFEKFEPAEYRSPNTWEQADPTKVRWPEDKNKTPESTDRNKTFSDFIWASKFVQWKRDAEAHANSIDHPTPAEILAWLDWAFGGSAEKPKDSSEWVAQIAEWNASQRENPVNA